MGNSSGRIPKQKLGVEIELDDGRLIYGYLFCTNPGRLTDLLNDDRVFLPFELADGKFTSLKKASLRAITPAQAPESAYEGNDPYRILGVPRNVHQDELKQAWRSLSAENHPDQLQGTGATAEAVEAATRRMTRINGAYARIMKQYEEARPTPAD